MLGVRGWHKKEGEAMKGSKEEQTGKILQKIVKSGTFFLLWAMIFGLVGCVLVKSESSAPSKEESENVVLSCSKSIIQSTEHSESVFAESVPPSPTPPSPSVSEDEEPCMRLSDEKNGTVAVWWWNKSKAYPGNREKYLAFLEKNDVNEIYLCWPNFKKEQLAAFVKAAGKRGIRVSLLSGDASWIDPENKGADTVIEDFLSYQQSAAQDERLLSLHMDVEPHQREDFWEDQQRVLQDYADFVKKTAKSVREKGERIGWDVPFWFDEFTVRDDTEEDRLLLEVLAAHADTLCLMSYRDSAQGVLLCAEKELRIGQQYGCQVICGVETHSAEGDHVSFMEEGKGYMYEQCTALYEALSEQQEVGKFGIAIHYLDTWYNLKD